MSGHLLWRDTFSMYGLFYHVNVPLMRGHLVNAGSGQDILFFSLLRWTVIIIFVIFFSKCFISKMATDKQYGV